MFYILKYLYYKCLYNCCNLLINSEFTTNFDDLVDKHISEIQEVGMRVAEPFKTVNRNYSLMTFIDLTLREGWIRNLPSFYRAGPCFLKYRKNRLSINLKIGWHSLYIDYRYTLKLKLLPVSIGDFQVIAQDPSINAVIVIETDTYRSYLEKIEVIDFCTCDLRTKGSMSTVINKLLEQVSRDAIAKEIESISRILIQQKLDDLNVHLKEIQFQPKLIPIFKTLMISFYKKS